MVTRNDVARQAGTSTAVVSYVVNDGPRPVAPETRARVLAAVADLGYRPNTIARSLRGTRSNTIGVLLDDYGRQSAALLAGAEAAANDAGVTLVIGARNGDADRAAEHVRAFVDRQADGLLLLTQSVGAGVLGELTRSKVPSVGVFPIAGDASESFLDEAAALPLLVEHLAEHGHRQPALATDGSADLGDRSAIHIVGQDETDVASRVVDALDRPDPPSAVICSSVTTAMAIEAEWRRRRPEAIDRPALAALADDLDDRYAALFGITVASHPWREIGALATTTLFDRIGDPTSDVEPTPVVPPQLRCRLESIGVATTADTTTVDVPFP